MIPLDAIILAGGRATRLGGAAKPLLEVDGMGLLARTVMATRTAGARRIVVVGEPVLDDAGLEWVREDPPFGGPVAAIVAALGHVTADWTLVLACDVPGIDQALRLLPLKRPEGDGAHLRDSARRPQWLTALYRTSALRSAAEALPDRGRDASVRSLVGGLRLAVVEAPATATRDVDTWEDLEWARSQSGAAGEDVTMSDSELSDSDLSDSDLSDSELSDSSKPSKSSERNLPPEALDEWANALGERFELTNDEVHVALVLDLARDVANDVARPAAPVSAFVAGLVAGRAGGSPESVREAVHAITELAQKWAERH